MNHRATQVSTVTWAWSIPEQSGIAVVTDDAELERSRWDEMEGATTVEVTYVPTEPWISKVIDGEVEDTDFTKTALGRYGLSTGAMRWEYSSSLRAYCNGEGGTSTLTRRLAKSQSSDSELAGNPQPVH